jgi:hypothetical protein
MQKSSQASPIAVYLINSIFLALTIVIFLLFSGIVNKSAINATDYRFQYVIIETIIFSFINFIIMALFKKWWEKRNKVIRDVFLLVLFMNLAFFLSILKKYLFYLLIENPISSDTYFGKMISNFSFSMIFSAFATFFTFLFYCEVFENEKKNKQIQGLLIVILLISVFILMQPIQEKKIEQIVESFLILSLSLFVYIPIAVKSLILIKKFKENPELKGNKDIYGFYFLFLISFSLILVWVFNLSANIHDRITGGTYSIFYLLQIAATLATSIFAYLGFVMPAWFKKLLTKLI